MEERFISPPGVQLSNTISGMNTHIMTNHVILMKLALSRRRLKPWGSGNGRSSCSRPSRSMSRSPSSSNSHHAIDRLRAGRGTTRAEDARGTPTWSRCPCMQACDFSRLSLGKGDRSPGVRAMEGAAARGPRAVRAGLLLPLGYVTSRRLADDRQ